MHGTRSSLKAVTTLKCHPDHFLDIPNDNARRLLQHRLVLRLAEPLPPVQPVLRLDRQRLVTALDHRLHLPRAQVLPALDPRQLRVLLEQAMVVPRHADQRVDGARLGLHELVLVRVAELEQEVAGLDELVEEVVVGGRVRQESLPGRQRERVEVDDLVEQVGGVGERLDVLGVGCQEADKGEQAAP